MARYALLGLLTLCVPTTLAACGSSNSITTTSETAKVATAPKESGSKRSGRKHSNSVSGHFEATPVVGDGYTVDVSYELSDIEADIDIANAEPGQAIVYGSATGGLTVTNTTPQRNTSFEFPVFHAALFWERSKIPGDLEASVIEPSERVCTAFRGTTYCQLAAINFAIAFEDDLYYGDESTLGPDESATMRALIASESQFGVASLTVEESYANSLAKFIRSTPPDQVWIHGPDSVGGIGALGVSCISTGIAETIGDPTENGPIAILSSRGQVLVSDRLDLSEGRPLECSEA